jgi:hypothetical protein
MIGHDGVRDAERGEMGKEVGGVHGQAPEVESPLLPRLTASSRRRESHYSWRSTGVPIRVDHRPHLPAQSPLEQGEAPGVPVKPLILFSGDIDRSPVSGPISFATFRTRLMSCSDRPDAPASIDDGPGNA